MRISKFILGFGIFWLGPIGIAQACSPVVGYRIPTNYELVEQADLVFIGRTTSTDEDEADWRGRPSDVAQAEPLEVLKGSYHGPPLRLFGTIGVRERPIAPQVTGLDEVHRSTLAGACIRQHYARRGLVLALFNRLGDGTWRESNFTFARNVEDIGDPATSIWVEVARLYVRISNLPESERREALVAANVRYAEVGTVRGQRIAEDIGRALAVDD